MLQPLDVDTGQIWGQGCGQGRGGQQAPPASRQYLFTAGGWGLLCVLKTETVATKIYQKKRKKMFRNFVLIYEIT